MQVTVWSRVLVTIALLLCMYQSVRTQDSSTGGQEDCVIDVTLLVDISGSVSKENNKISNLKYFLSTFVNVLDNVHGIGEGVASSRVGVITFETKAATRLPLSGDKNQILRVIDGIDPTNGWTNYIRAFELAIDMYSSSADRRPDRLYHDCVGLITDGRPTVTRNGTRIHDTDHSARARTLRRLMKADIRKLAQSLVYHNEPVGSQFFSQTLTDDPLTLKCVAVTNSTDEEFLASLDTTGQFVKAHQLKRARSNPYKMTLKRPKLTLSIASDFDKLQQQADQYAQELLTECAANCRVKGSDVPPISGEDLTRSGCIDLAVAVDMSGSVMQTRNVTMVKQKIQELLSELTPKYPGIHYALLKFSDEADVLLNLGAHNLSILSTAVDEQLFSGGWTGTAKLLQLARTAVFNKGPQDRVEGQDILIVFTDGWPTRSTNGTNARVHGKRIAERRFIEQEVIAQGALLQDQGVSVTVMLIEGTDSNNQDLMSQMATEVITLRSFDEAVAQFEATLNSVIATDSSCT